MPFFIFNQNDKQRADFYQSQITDVEILWQGESVDAFTAETGFSIEQLGGFVLEEGTLTFNQQLYDGHNTPPPPPPLSTEEKRIMLAQQLRQLPAITRRDFKQVAQDVDAYLRNEDIENAIYTLEEAKLQPNADTALIQNMINFLGEE